MHPSSCACLPKWHRIGSFLEAHTRVVNLPIPSRPLEAVCQYLHYAKRVEAMSAAAVSGSNRVSAIEPYVPDSEIVEDLLLASTYLDV